MLELAILGALKERPMHGYELKKRLSYPLGHLWKTSFGSLYPALKRLESRKAIKKAYSVKEKTRNRYVYRITTEGDELFRKLLVDTRKNSEITDADKFSLRMSFFQYMEPEMRLWLLEKRRNYLLEKLNEMSGLAKGRHKESDSYRQGLFRHRQEMMRNDISWLNEMIEKEKGNLSEENPNRGKARKKGRGGDQPLIDDESWGNMTPLQV